ncbi:hypothetical protein CC78DRAFT_464536 [Lojkania enalia]|uniref:Uncharacterized protein n=1 Tax=Lojkania enalia TaxID=147567 RepID=A0A9P4KCH2_9PLEO|nr:hypothetical protein CC78DRAFT_464536 [Didymosphaeria enalia]
MYPSVQYINTDVTSFSSRTASFESVIAFSPHKTVHIVLNAGLPDINLDTSLDPQP